MNEVLLICILIVGILTILISNKFLNTLGLKILFIIFSFITLVLSFKHLTLSTLQINANIISYSVMFTAICLLLEQNKIKEINKLIIQNIIIIIFSCFLLYIMSYYTQSLNDTIGINMTNVFINNSRILIVYPICLFISNKLLIFIYNKIKKLYSNIFISMVTTYMASGIVYLILYYFIVYIQKLKVTNIIKLLLSTYMSTLIIVVIYSIVFTIISSKKVKK